RLSGAPDRGHQADGPVLRSRPLAADRRLDRKSDRRVIVDHHERDLAPALVDGVIHRGIIAGASTRLVAWNHATPRVAPCRDLPRCGSLSWHREAFVRLCDERLDDLVEGLA